LAEHLQAKLAAERKAWPDQVKHLISLVDSAGDAQMQDAQQRILSDGLEQMLKRLSICSRPCQVLPACLPPPAAKIAPFKVAQAPSQTGLANIWKGEN
jgi:hypothetical protein